MKRLCELTSGIPGMYCGNRLEFFEATDRWHSRVINKKREIPRRKP